MQQKMKAVILKGPNDFSVELADVPSPAHKEVLVRVKSVAVCGSDPSVFAYTNAAMPRLPFIPGHEFAGEVAALGGDVTEFKVGDRVAGEAHCGCGYCENCKAGRYNLCLNYKDEAKGHRHYGFTYNGCYAQYNAYNVKALHKLPDNVSFDEGALCDPAGTSYQAVNLPGVTPGGYSLIIGPGPIGIFAMQFAKAMGSTTIMVGRRERLKMAGKFGADYLIDYEAVSDIVGAVLKITGGVGADEAFECSASQTGIAQAIKGVKKGGRLSLVGMAAEEDAQVPVKTIVMNQLTVYGVRANPNVSPKVLSMFSKGMVDARGLITHHFTLDDIKEALDTFVNRTDGAMKVIVHP